MGAPQLQQRILIFKLDGAVSNHYKPTYVAALWGLTGTELSATGVSISIDIFSIKFTLEEFEIVNGQRCR